MNQHQFDLIARRFAAADRRAFFRAALVAIAVNTFGGLGRQVVGQEVCPGGCAEGGLCTDRGCMTPCATIATAAASMTIPASRIRALTVSALRRLSSAYPAPNVVKASVARRRASSTPTARSSTPAVGADVVSTLIASSPSSTLASSVTVTRTVSPVGRTRSAARAPAGDRALSAP